MSIPSQQLRGDVDDRPLPSVPLPTDFFGELLLAGTYIGRGRMNIRKRYLQYFRDKSNILHVNVIVLSNPFNSLLA